MNRLIYQLENISIEITTNSILIWKNHDKNYEKGSYYEININTKNIKLVFDTGFSITEYEIPDDLKIILTKEIKNERI